jgi:hypothetical protein
MAYLNLDPDYFEHPKTRRLVGLLGPKSEIYPIRLWCYCSKYHPENGRFINYAAQEIEAILHWEGEKGLCVTSMEKVGFLNKKGAVYEINDWKEHEGHIINYKKRSQLAARARWDKIKKNPDATSNAKSVPKHPNHTIPTLPTKHDIDSTEIYAYYAKTIKPGAKEDAIKNIAKLLKTGFSKEDLLGRVNAYAKQLAAAGKQDKQYYIQANNFFGQAARFKDFEPLKIVVWLPPDKACKACHGFGKVQNGEGQVMRCSCVKEK